MLRYCHRTTCNFGSGVTGDIQWYFVTDSEAKFLTEFVPLNKFGSASWLDDYSDDNSLGEVIGATRTMTDGTLPEYPCACEPTGDLHMFLNGVDPNMTPLTLNDHGIPLECVDVLGAFDDNYDPGYYV